MGKKESEVNPVRYAKCSEPFESVEAANVAMRAFFEAVSAAREQYLVADVSIAVKDSTADGTFMSTAHYGDALNREVILAYALGEAREERRQILADLLSGKNRKVKAD